VTPPKQGLPLLEAAIGIPGPPLRRLDLRAKVPKGLTELRTIGARFKVELNGVLIWSSDCTAEGEGGEPFRATACHWPKLRDFVPHVTLKRAQQRIAAGTCE
jgi:hypothetical protein